MLSDSLRTLHLSENSINEISANKHQHHSRNFSKLRKILKIDLSSNSILDIQPNALPKTIMTIDLSKNLLSTIPLPILNHLHDLRILYLRDNLITSLNDITFGGLRSQLEKLDLSQNCIYSLPRNLFNCSTQVRAVNFDLNFISHIPPHAFNHTNILHLVLSNNFISDVHEDAFVTLENHLEYLDFEGNSLSVIPSAIEKLRNLRYLYLTSNEINSIDFLPSTLKVLSLSTNNLSFIPKEILSDCTELSYLNMGYNQINFIEPFTFLNWGEKMQTLLLRNNKLGILPHDVFAGLESLKELSLSFNNLHFIHPLTFENISKSLKILEMSFSMSNDDLQIDEILSPLSELVWLTLDNNNLKKLSNHSFALLYELAYIDLSFNRLTKIPRDLFQSQTHKHLLEIDISHNLIEKLYSKTFNNLETLQSIDLSCNKVKCIEHSSFYNLPHLTDLDLSYNQLKSLAENIFEHLPNLQRVDMSFNNLVTFSLKSFKHVSNASAPMSINISNNAINHFDGDLSTYLYIYSLDVSNNKVTDPQTFKNIGYSLRSLYLNGNMIKTLNNHAMGDLPVLEILNLSFNNISILRRRSFQGLMNLLHLDLSHNDIENLQIEQFSNLIRLRYLRLNENRIKALPRDVFMNTRIEFLDLSNNFLNVWPVNSFSDVGFTLRAIIISNNSLEYLDSTMFMNIQYLTELNLSRNKIKILPDNTFSSLINLTSLDLSYNPLVTANFKELLINMQHLKDLNLRSISLQHFPTIFLNNLMNIDLSKNHLKDADLLFHNFKNLRKLIVSENKISNLTIFLKNLPPTLRHLEISRNPIHHFSMHDFLPIKHLENLVIERITISNVATLSILRNLKVLKISLSQNFNELISQVNSLRELYLLVNDYRISEKHLGNFSSNPKLNYIEITGNKLRSFAPNTFRGLSRNINLKICIRDTMIKELPIQLFSPNSFPKLSVDFNDNKLLARFSSDAFYPNSSFFNKHGTRNFFGGISIRGENSIMCDCEHVWYGVWLRRWLKEKSQTNTLSKGAVKNLLKVIYWIIFYSTNFIFFHR